jgi:hypothetical protein
MTDFPENEIEILPDFLNDDLKALWGPMRTALRAAAVPITGPITEPNADRVDKTLFDQILSTRQRLGQFLSHEDNLTNLGTLGTQFKGRDFDEALSTINEHLTEFASVPRIIALGEAFHATPVNFDEIIEEDQDEDPGGHHGSKPKKIVHHWLRGYKGPNPTPEERRKILAWSAFLSNDSDQRFQVRLLQAEASAGLRRFDGEDGAIAFYQKLLDALPPDSPRHKFVAIRSAFAQLAFGDTLFRRSFRFDSEKRIEIGKVYDGAIELIRTSDVSPENPLYKQIIDYGEQQKAKLEAGQNFLGYRDSFVPDLKLSTLAENAQARITLAQHASEQFEKFKEKADALVEELAAMSQQQLEEELGVGIANDRVQNAIDRVNSAQEKIDELDDKLDFLTGGSAADLTKSLFFTAALSASEPTNIGFQANGPGLLSTAVGYFAAKNETEHQKRAAESEKSIASRDKAIADLEKRIADSKLQFVKDAIAAKKSGTFNADRFFALANAYEDMTRRNVDAAFEHLYLFERAIAFRRLKPLDVVEPVVTTLDPLLAPSKLDEIFTTLQEAAKANGKGQNAFSLPPWSLRTHYPIEFARFVQAAPTEGMEFVISLYDVEKLLHGTFNVRIKKVSVEVAGFVPPSGFIGRLTHRGVTLLRDLEATLNPPSGRLLPTDVEVQQAIADLESGRKDRVVVEGVVPLVLGEDFLLISSEPDAIIAGDDAQFDLAPIENYGLTGTWHLSIEGLDLRRITDVSLRFVVSLPEADSQLDTHILGLIDAYETELADGGLLDLILPISLRQRFADTFFQLETGPGSFVLRDEDVPDGITELRVKALVAQAVDQDGKGVAGLGFEISKLDTSFSLTRSTGADGFSENLSADLPEIPEPRPLVTGAWQIRLLNPAQFASLDDLRLFYVYTFRKG